MKKKLFTLVAAGMMTAAMSLSAFAGDWKQDQTGWWYQNDDGSYLNNGWNLINGKSYYFGADGYLLTSTVTPDGYTVDASGAWVVDGVVQTQGGQAAASTAQAQSYSVAGLTFTVPAGLAIDAEKSDTNNLFFYNANYDGGVAIVSEDIPGAEQYGALMEMYSETILDGAMNEIGTPAAKGVKQFVTGTWYCYLYNGTAQLNIPMDEDISEQIYVYGRIKDARVQMVMIIGNTGIGPDDIMANYLR